MDLVRLIFSFLVDFLAASSSCNTEGIIAFPSLCSANRHILYPTLIFLAAAFGDFLTYINVS